MLTIKDWTNPLNEPEALKPMTCLKAHTDSGTLSLRGSDSRTVESLRVSRGQQFVLSDGHHVHFTYRFRGITEGSIILIEQETSDTRSMGGSVDTKRRAIAVEPYESRTEQPAAQLQSEGAPSDRV